MTAEQQQRWNQIEAKLDRLAEHGYTLEQLLEQQELQEKAKAVPAIEKDLMALRSVLADAIEYSGMKNAGETRAALERMENLVRAVTADLPASQVVVHAERALAYLSQNLLNEAGAELAVAYDVVHNAHARLRPPQVETMIQSRARDHISAGRVQDAAQVVRAIIERASGHESLQRMRRVAQGLEGAMDALEREAWPVVEAELVEMHREVSALDEAIRVARGSADAEAVDEATSDEGEEAAPAAEAEASAEDEAEEPAAQQEAPAEGQETEAAQELPGAPGERMPTTGSR